MSKECIRICIIPYHFKMVQSHGKYGTIEACNVLVEVLVLGRESRMKVHHHYNRLSLHNDIPLGLDGECSGKVWSNLPDPYKMYEIP